MSQSLLAAHPEFSHLNEYSLSVAEWFLTRHPEWIEFAYPQRSSDSLVIVIPSPFEPQRGLHIDTLIISTWNRALSLQYCLWFHVIGEASDEEEFQVADNLINDILQERVVVAVKHDEHGIECGKIYRVDELDLLLADRLYTRSWKGTYNRSFE